jgi:ssDNA-binding replication factor A large subunit
MEKDKERYEEAQKIVETFIEQFSPKEINIGMESRKEVLKLFEESSVDNCPFNLFDDAVTDVLLMMKNDQFKRFVSMKEFTELVRRISEETFQSFAKLK